jgi:hypothetical protein
MLSSSFDSRELDRPDKSACYYPVTRVRLDRHTIMLSSSCSRRQRVPFFRQSPPLGRAFRQTCQGGFVVDTSVEMLAPMGEIVEQKGTSCRRLVSTQFGRRIVEKCFENVRKRIRKGLFGILKCSFGRHKASHVVAIFCIILQR